MDDTRSDIRKHVTLLLALIALAAYCAFCAFTDTMPRCPFKWATGFDCPGCGSQRAVRALLAGHPMEAWSYNLLLPPMVAYLLAILILPMAKNKTAGKAYAMLTSPPAIMSLAAVVILWWLIRNLT